MHRGSGSTDKKAQAARDWATARRGGGSSQPGSQPDVNSNSSQPSRASQPASQPTGQPARRKQRQQPQPAEPASQLENTREGPVPPQHATDERNVQGSPEPARRGATHPRTIPRADEERRRLTPRLANRPTRGRRTRATSYSWRTTMRGEVEHLRMDADRVRKQRNTAEQERDTQPQQTDEKGHPNEKVYQE